MSEQENLVVLRERGRLWRGDVGRVLDTRAVDAEWIVRAARYSPSSAEMSAQSGSHVLRGDRRDRRRSVLPSVAKLMHKGGALIDGTEASTVLRPNC
jgi:hypothetical protein